MTKTLLVFASEMEANACLNYFLPHCNQDTNIHEFSSGYILICGMGTISAAAQVGQHAHLVDRIWNFGIAGSLHDHLLIGSVQKVMHVSKHLSLYPNLDAHSVEFSQRIFPTLPVAESGLRLMSSDYPVYLPVLRQQLAQVSDLIDMEGYGIALAAKLAKKECMQWKLVSDLASPGNWVDIKQNIARLSEQLLECAKEALA